MTSRSVVLVSLGPVQPFIAAARSGRDLWAGSTLLSRASAQLAKALAAGRPEALVFPAVEAIADLDREDFPVANRVLAIVEGDARTAAADASEVTRRWLADTARAAFAALPESPGFARALAQEQIEDLLEIHWAAVPFAEQDEWPEVRRRVDKLLAARKGTRNFRQPPQSEASASFRKSSIDGRREAVVSLGDAARSDRHPAWPEYRVQRDEWLCGVSLFKRRVFDTEASRVPSTTGIAAAPTVARLQASAPDAYRRFCDNMEARSADDRDSWLFAERLPDCFDDEPRAKAAAELLRGLFDATRVERPSPYYALLRADGDAMGELISKKKNVEEHRRLSSDLVWFARAARTIVADHQGHAIYTGGDDVLALLPVPNALACATVIAKAFSEHVKGATLSAGLVIAHHLDPLADTLERSHAAEKAAKVSRDALAVLLAKRSGPDVIAALPWAEVTAALIEPGKLLAAGRIPAGVAHELRDAALRIGKTDEKQALQAAEARRILSRKQPGRGEAKALDKETRERLEARAARGLEQLAAELLVARALTSGEGGAS